MSNSSLENKKILIVDDEPDVLDSLEELLDMCTTVRAETYGEANTLLKTQEFDIAVLDIMGVDGYQLLETANKKNVVTVMLTAHALTPENLKESIQKGADSYIPKDELANLTDHVADVIKARIAGKQGYGAWFSILKPFFDKSFGKGWRNKDRSFWNNFDGKYGGNLPRV